MDDPPAPGAETTGQPGAETTGPPGACQLCGTPVPPVALAWMMESTARGTAWTCPNCARANLRAIESKLARNLNLPPSYLLIHRVTFGSIGVMCQLDATAPFREIVTENLAGFNDAI